MSWHKTSDGFYSHPKVKQLPLRHRAAAAGLWILAASWCSGNEVEKAVGPGHIPKFMLGDLSGTVRLAEHLVKVGLWEVDGDGDGWWFHDWLDYREDPAKKAAKAAKHAQSQARHMAKKASTGTVEPRRSDRRASTPQASSDPDSRPPADIESADRSVTPPRPVPNNVRDEDGTEGSQRTVLRSAPAVPPEPPQSGPKPSLSDAAHRLRAAEITASPWAFTATLPNGAVRIQREPLDSMDDAHVEITVCIQFDHQTEADAGRIAETLERRFKPVGDRERRTHHCRAAADPCGSGWSDNYDVGMYSAWITTNDARVAEVDAEMRAIVEAVVDDEHQQSVIVSDPEDEFGAEE